MGSGIKSIEKLYNLSKHVASICRMLSGSNVGAHVNTLVYIDMGEHRYACDYFGEHFPNTFRELKRYHYRSDKDTLEECFKEFQSLKYPKLREAQILYDKGFDVTDLLMLADLVEDENLATILRETTVLRRGFWAIDVLREL